MSSLGERIRQAREAKGMSKADLAHRVKMSNAAIGFLENGGSKDLAGANVFPMADALGVSARWLMTGRETDSDDPPIASPMDEAATRLARALALVDEERLQAVMTLLNLRK